MHVIACSTIYLYVTHSIGSIGVAEKASSETVQSPDEPQTEATRADIDEVTRPYFRASLGSPSS